MAPQVQIDPASVFIASGGAKGITAECVKTMARTFPCKWILLGRSQRLNLEPVWARGCFDESELKKRIMDYLLAQGEKPTPIKIERTFKEIASTREITSTLQSLEQLGVEAEYISVDITDSHVLHKKLSDAIARLGPVSGILHGAGNLADKLIEKKTDRDYRLVCEPKVRGLENLLSTVDSTQLKYLIVFSSVSGFYGNAGQTDYAIANEVLTKSAHAYKRNNPDCHVAAINWGAWDSGMVSPQLKKAFEINNVSLIPIDRGADVLVRELEPSNRTTVQSIIGSPLPVPVTSLGTKLLTHRIHRQLLPEDNPFLFDHQIEGHPVLPATCAMSWIASSSEQLYPGYQFFSLTDFRVLKGIVFNRDIDGQFTLELVEVSKSKISGIEFDATIFSQNTKGQIRYHFKARSKLLPSLPNSPRYNSIDFTEDEIMSGSKNSFYKNDGIGLFHGAMFQGIDRVLNISPDRITARVNLSPVEASQQGQFQVKPFNGFLRDAELHPAWLWSQFYHQLGALPSKTASFEQFCSPSFGVPYYASIEIVSKTATSLTSNIFAHDIDGHLYSRSLGSVATLIPIQGHGNASSDR